MREETVSHNTYGVQGKMDGIMKKREDYRIKIYQLYCQTMKQCKQFIQQKLIRKIKKHTDAAYGLGDTMDDVSKKLEFTNRAKKSEEQMNLLKTFKTQQMKALALVFLIDEKKYDLEKCKEYFNKEFLGDYKKAYEAAKESLQDKNSQSSVFKRKLLTRVQYLNMLQQADAVTSMVDRKLGKSKVKRQIKKERYKLKMQNKLPKQNNETGDKVEKDNNNDKMDVEGNEPAKEEEKKNPRKEKKEQKKAKRAQEMGVVLKYDKLVKQYKTEPKERTEFKKKGKERKEQIKQEKKEWRSANNNQNKDNNNNKIVDFAKQNLKQIDQLHPSWAARLQQQQTQQNTLSAFSGTIKML